MLIGGLEAQARAFAIERHGAACQVRKYTGEPYIVHPEEVANLVRSVPCTEEMLAAAWLHDVVEDTFISRSQGIQEVYQRFGGTVGFYVDFLTDVSQPSDGNRATRKAMDRQHIARAPALVKTIKLADLISNSYSITEHDSDFAVVYMKEKQRLLEVLQCGDPLLYAKAKHIVDSYYANR